eukprot:5950286-Prorocentrum_lima.AAC.1
MSTRIEPRCGGAYDPAGGPPNDLGLACWLCYPVWAASVAPTWPGRDREQYIRQLASDLSLLEKHKEIREEKRLQTMQKLAGGSPPQVRRCAEAGFQRALLGQA